MNIKTATYILLAMFLLWLLIRLFVEIPVDCTPTIGPEPVLEKIFKILFRTKCVTY